MSKVKKGFIVDVLILENDHYRAKVAYYMGDDEDAQKLAHALAKAMGESQQKGKLGPHIVRCRPGEVDCE